MTTFPGFEEPKENYYRLPNDWFDQVHLLREAYGTRLAAPIKLLEYVLKHTWGFQRFDGQVSLTAKEIYAGRFHRGKRVDQGTGLSENSVQKSAQALVEQGYLDLLLDDTDPARRKRAYRPRTLDATPEKEPTEKPFEGFELPRESYFKVPKRWTDLTRDVKSATLILTVEYFFRHAWGYHNNEGVWMEAEDIAHGRRYRDGRRYDQGTRFDVSSIHRTLQEAVERKLLVWTDYNPRENGARLYNLRFEGMKLSEEGEYLGPLPWNDEAIGDLEEGSGNLEEPKGNLGASHTPSSIEIHPLSSGKLEVVTRNLEEGSGKLEEPKSDLEGGIRNLEARTATGDTFKDTSLKDTSINTPATTPLAPQPVAQLGTGIASLEAAAAGFPPELQTWQLELILETEGVPLPKRRALLQAIQQKPALGYQFLARMLEGYEKATRKRGGIDAPIFYALSIYRDAPLQKYLELAHLTPDSLRALLTRSVYAAPPPQHLQTTLAHLRESELMNLLATLAPSPEAEEFEETSDEEAFLVEEDTLTPPEPEAPVRPLPTRGPSCGQEAWTWITRATQIERPTACFSACLERNGLAMSFREAEPAHLLLAQLQTHQGTLQKVLPGFAIKMDIFALATSTYTQPYQPPALCETLTLQL